MFETDILALETWICENTTFKSLGKTFDDRYLEDGFLIKPDLFIQFVSTFENTVKAIQKCSIFIQYTDNDSDKLRTLVANLLDYFTCDNTEIISIDIDSKEVFEAMTKEAKKFNSKTYKFASLNINFSVIITPQKACNPC